MEIIIHELVKKIDSSYEAAMKEYIKRCSFFCKISIKKYKKAGTAALAKDSAVFLVCPGRSTISSEDFCKLLADIRLSGKSCIEFVTNPKLLSDCHADYDEFNLSSFDMSTELSVVVLCEQIYRAFTIENNITYHK